MYFRAKTIKSIPVVQLVESFRNPEGQPRQRILAFLGDAHVPDVGFASAANIALLKERGLGYLINFTRDRAGNTRSSSHKTALRHYPGVNPKCRSKCGASPIRRTSKTA